MDWIEFGHLDRAVWLPVVLVVVLFLTWMVGSHRRRLGEFVSRTMQGRLVTRPNTANRVMQTVCLLLSGCLLVIALMQPQIVQTERVSTPKDAANIFVALDVSKSMLATDVEPSRLDRAKAEIRDMLGAFTKHRVGLLAFAGRTTVLSPLTTDHGFFRLVLDTASPSSVTLGGTNIGDVIRKATRLLRDHEGPKVLLLISDGEDHESYPEEAADEARKEGIVIVSVGFGDPAGTTIDVLDKATGTKKRVTDASGRDVITKLDAKMLTDIALKTGGAYIPAGTNVMELDEIMTSHIIPLVDSASQVQERKEHVDIFPWFVGFGMLFFLGFMLLEGRGVNRRMKEKEA